MKTLLHALAFLVLTVLASTAAGDGAGRPNNDFILADDLGLDGVGCYGSDQHKTPNIDKLAGSGLRFETCYAAPLCGPSRCLLMTGRFAFRTGGLNNQSWRPGGPGPKSADENPIPRLLQRHRGADRFAPSIVVHSNNSAFADVRVFQKCRFNFQSGEFVAAALDDVDGLTAHDAVVATLQHRHVAGAEPATIEGFRAALGRFQYAQNTPGPRT